jgi:hypothetical protein
MLSHQPSLYSPLSSTGLTVLRTSTAQSSGNAATASRNSIPSITCLSVEGGHVTQPALSISGASMSVTSSRSVYPTTSESMTSKKAPVLPLQLLLPTSPTALHDGVKPLPQSSPTRFKPVESEIKLKCTEMKQTTTYLRLPSKTAAWIVASWLNQRISKILKHLHNQSDAKLHK